MTAFLFGEYDGWKDHILGISCQYNKYLLSNGSIIYDGACQVCGLYEKDSCTIKVGIFSLSFTLTP